MNSCSEWPEEEGEITGSWTISKGSCGIARKEGRREGESDMRMRRGGREGVVGERAGGRRGRRAWAAARVGRREGETGLDSIGTRDEGGRRGRDATREEE